MIVSMPSHPVFADLLLHDDDELAALLGAGLVERRTIHEWPLSCVQRLRLDDGRVLIYKSQLPPTVEAAFYARVRSPLLPGHRLLGKLGRCDTLTIDWIDAPMLRHVARSDAELAEHGWKVIAEIGEIRGISGISAIREFPSQRDGGLPVHLDVGSIDAWRENAAMTLEKLRALVRDGRFHSIDLAAVDAVTRWSASAEMLATFTAEPTPRLTHGDLKGDQIFVTPADGYRVIDWQRPVIAPPAIDLVSLLVEEGIEPRRFMDLALVRMFWFLRLCWAVEAQFDLFPDVTSGPFDGWSTRAVRHLVA